MKRKGGSYGLILTQHDIDELELTIEGDDNYIGFDNPLWKTNSFLKQINDLKVYYDNVSSWGFKRDKIFELTLDTTYYQSISTNLAGNNNVLVFVSDDGTAVRLSFDLIDDVWSLDIVIATY